MGGDEGSTVLTALIQPDIWLEVGKTGTRMWPLRPNHSPLEMTPSLLRLQDYVFIFGLFSEFFPTLSFATQKNSERLNNWPKVTHLVEPCTPDPHLRILGTVI